MGLALQPGFEPGSPARKAGMIGRTTLLEDILKNAKPFLNLVLKTDPGGIRTHDLRLRRPSSYPD